MCIYITCYFIIQESSYVNIKISQMIFVENCILMLILLSLRKIGMLLFDNNKGAINEKLQKRIMVSH
ncbi:MAG: hypothetical protein A2X47_03175 [Lentisphaerae bacterium GWF2_38_69]|nr:MAG: hypothetical protein A2X47_03175 [Lentisphaerae bacterium GWF2_38_69]